MILGNDIIFPDEITKARGLSYADVDLKRFADTMPSEEALRWCKVNGCAVITGPPSPMGLLEVRSLKPDHFWFNTGGWYERHTFSHRDKAKTEWLAIRKEPVSKSTHKSWDKQLRLLSKDERVPNADEMNWFITTFYKVRGVRLSKKVYVRTSSVTSDSSHVNVGGFDESGLYVYYSWDDECRYLIGVAASRKF